MVFSEIPFLLYFFPLFLLCYFISPARIKNLTLLIFSLLFYAWGEPVYILLLLLSSVVDYVNGRALERFEGKKKIQVIFLCISVAVNLGLMGIFKYAGLFIDTVNSVFGCGIKPVGLKLPLGISFFTFQTMSYSIDVYRRDVKAEHSFINYMTYVCMFPQLVAGPIVRYSDISEKLKNRKTSVSDFCSGFVRFLMGLFKKVLIANQVGLLWNIVLAADERSLAFAWLGLLAYSLQIYFDFSGYSDMAIGMGKMLGFSYPENFNYPYICTSITDFWRRWHMTLSGWFRDYVYIPLGGNRKGRARQMLNLAIVWALTGLWHGAAWNFLLWGMYFGLILIIEKLTGLPKKLPKPIGRLYSLILIMLGWMIFAIEDLKKLAAYASDIFGFGANGFAGKEFFYQLNNYLFVLLTGAVLCTPVFPKLAEKAKGNETAEKTLGIIGLLAGMLLTAVCIAMLVADSYNPFLYFRF